MSIHMTNRELYLLCLALSDEIKKNRNKFIALLPEVAKRKLYLEQGMHSIYEFAAKLGCISRDIVNRVLKVSEKLEKKPVLKEMFDSGEIGWSKLEVAVKLPIEEKEVAKILPTISKDALTLLAREAKQKEDTAVSKQVGFAGEASGQKDLFAGEEVSGFASEERIKDPRKTFMAKMHPSAVARLEVFKRNLEKELKRPLSWEEVLMKMVERSEKPVPRTQRASKPSRQQKTPRKSPKKTISRHIPAVIKREALAKTKQLCSKCNKPAEHLHHEIPFSVSRSHESIVPLCKAHHDLIHHMGDNYVNWKYQEHKGRQMRL